MTFSLDIWKERTKIRLKKLGEWLGRLKKRDAPYLVYGSLCGLSLWPLVEAAQAGQLLPVMMALGSVAGGLGGNLLANQVQSWKDQAESVDEHTVGQWVSERAANDPDLRQALDAILDKLQIVTEAQAGLTETDRQWFCDTLRSEMAQLGNLSRFEAVLSGRGAIAQGDGARAAMADHGGVAVAGDVKKLVVDRSTRIEAAEVYPDTAETQRAEARKRYLESLRRYCQALPLAALGGEEDAAEDLTLDRIYIDLDTTTRIPSTGPELTAERDRLGVSLEDHPEQRNLTALEAAAQTPRLALLGGPGAGKSTFARKILAWLAAANLGETAPPPGVSADLLPVLITLRDLPPRLAALELDGLSEDRQNEALAAAIRDQVLADLDRMEAGDFGDELRTALANGKCLLVLDGLDEVPHDQRRFIRRAAAAVIRLYGAQRVILTCRKRSYVGDAVFPKFQDHTLAPFSREKIEQFARAWYRAQKEMGRFDAAQAEDKARDLADAALSSELRELSENPMLLTTMANIHQREIGLPSERVRLYNLAVEVLLLRWQKRKTGETGLASSAPLVDFIQDESRLRPVVERLAYEAHRAGQSKTGASDLGRGQILTLLEQPEHLGQAGLAAEFLDYVDQRSGLLVGRGGELSRPTEYSFPHRTFQEYLAGCFMISLRDVAREFFARAGEGDYWAVAAQLGGEELLYNLRRPNEILDLMYRLCPGAESENEQVLRAVLWAGNLAALIGSETIARDTGSPDGGPGYLDRLIQRLVTLLSSRLPPPERAEAGNCLAHLGDPRSGVGLGPDGMPDIVWCEVPPGSFVMGSRDDSLSFIGKETPQRQVELPAFKISQYPITNAQYRVFIEKGGYEDAGCWSEAASAGYWAEGRVRRFTIEGEEWASTPVDFGPPFNLANHPVVGLNWFEALAFAHWLTKQARQTGELSSENVVTLPSESQWEKAARGADGRIYPWGNEADPNRSNYSQTGIEATSTVGCFADGASTYNVQEMSGNVWEWCRTKWQEDYQDYADDNNLSGDASRVLRGGSFDGTV